jgi:hypothetical protein
MERKALKTCAGCRWNRKRVASGCTVTTESYCFVGQNYSHRKGYCDEFEPRFKIEKQVKKQMEVELL